ncbi:MAG: hypothetical protein EXR77_12775 [Myxococcales bacterium]|nr:hypothetical protein [Myxococcales bacterium]
MNKSFIYRARLLAEWVASSRLYSRLATRLFSQIDRVIALLALSSALACGSGAPAEVDGDASLKEDGNRSAAIDDTACAACAVDLGAQGDGQAAVDGPTDHLAGFDQGAGADQGTGAGDTSAASPDLATPTSADATATVDSASGDAVAFDGPTDSDTGTMLADATSASDAAASSDAKVKPPPVAPLPGSQGGPVPIELGGSSDDGLLFAPWLAPGQPVPLIFGPQGGYHLWVSFCVPQSVEQPLAVKVTLTDQATGLPVPPGPLALQTKLKVLADHPQQLCRLALPAFVDCACEMADRGVRVRLQIDTGTASAPAGSFAEWSVLPKHIKGPCLVPAPQCAPFSL